MKTPSELISSQVLASCIDTEISMASALDTLDGWQKCLDHLNILDRLFSGTSFCWMVRNALDYSGNKYNDIFNKGVFVQDGEVQP